MSLGNSAWRIEDLAREEEVVERSADRVFGWSSQLHSSRVHEHANPRALYARNERHAAPRRRNDHAGTQLRRGQGGARRGGLQHRHGGLHRGARRSVWTFLSVVPSSKRCAGETRRTSTSLPGTTYLRPAKSDRARGNVFFDWATSTAGSRVGCGRHRRVGANVRGSKKRYEMSASGGAVVGPCVLGRVLLVRQTVSAPAIANSPLRQRAL